jgi:hypothetical protein
MVFGSGSTQMMNASLMRSMTGAYGSANPVRKANGRVDITKTSQAQRFDLRQSYNIDAMQQDYWNRASAMGMNRSDFEYLMMQKQMQEMAYQQQKPAMTAEGVTTALGSIKDMIGSIKDLFS